MAYYEYAPRESYYCPLDDGDDFHGSANCGGRDFGSRLAVNMHFATVHLGSGPPTRLGIGPGRYPSEPADYASELWILRPFTAGDEASGFHGSPVIPNSSGWGMLGGAAGLGLGLPQAIYVVWSQGTPIAWYLNDSTGEGWVDPDGDYFRYDRVTSRHQSKISAAIGLLPDPDAGGTDPDAVTRLRVAARHAYSIEEAAR